IDKTSAWLSSFSTQLDDMASRVQLFIAPFRTLFNGVTTLIDKTSAWLSSFSTQLDDMASRVQLFIAPFRTLFNG
ncbi:hypothetical protein ACF0BS_30090, partial [Pseudomonas aeruginosa]